MSATGGDRRLVGFFRIYDRFSGGHLEVWRYFTYLRESSSLDAKVALELTGSDRWPWEGAPRLDLTVDHPAALFVEGRDWADWEAITTTHASVPRLNLVQDFLHVQPGTPQHASLAEEATRVVTSTALRDAILGTGLVRGPVAVVPPAVEEVTETDPAARRYDAIVLGEKQPERARRLAARLPERWNVRCLDHRLPRPAYLALLRDAAVAICLPYPLEGFYLPALEAMANGAVVVCPDVHGNRDFCIPGSTCIRPRRYVDRSIVAAARRVVDDPALAGELRRNGYVMAARHSVECQRDRVVRIATAVAHGEPPPFT